MFHWLLLDMKGHWQVSSAFISGMIEFGMNFTWVQVRIFSLLFILFAVDSWLLWEPKGVPNTSSSQ